MPSGNRKKKVKKWSRSLWWCVTWVFSNCRTAPVFAVRVRSWKWPTPVDIVHRSKDGLFSGVFHRDLDFNSTCHHSNRSVSMWCCLSQTFNMLETYVSKQNENVPRKSGNIHFIVSTTFVTVTSGCVFFNLFCFNVKWSLKSRVAVQCGNWRLLWYRAYCLCCYVA